MLKKSSGFIFAESLISLMIAVLITITLSYTVSAQFEMLHKYERKINAYRFIDNHIQSDKVPDKLTIKNYTYIFSKSDDLYQVRVNNEIYKIRY
ncbi:MULTISPECIES: hypothetical protein [Lactobacillaceae]|uniref:hypothetical protein n=1 Tax=Lactobacillaceae TaxID=33958 RepID=UPI000C1B6E1A|nr:MULTISPECIES: hypothetical protein [Lactobacillaceae]